MTTSPKRLTLPTNGFASVPASPQHIAAEGELTSDIAEQAAMVALADAGIEDGRHRSDCAGDCDAG